MSKPTPGPWTFSRWNEFGDMRFYIAQADGAPHTPQLSDVATLIAETPSNEWQSIQEANARLIAAAPELLASAQVVVAWWNEWAARQPQDDAIEAAEWSEFHALRAVIAKATGEQP